LPTPAPRALLADDNPAVLQMMSLYAETAGFEPVCAQDGLQALDMLSGGLQPAIVVTDIDMPHVDGRVLIQSIRASETLRSTPIIVFSGQPRPEDSGGADRWLQKSEALELIAALRALGAQPAPPPGPLPAPGLQAGFGRLA